MEFIKDPIDQSKTEIASITNREHHNHESIVSFTSENDSMEFIQDATEDFEEDFNESGSNYSIETTRKPNKQKRSKFYEQKCPQCDKIFNKKREFQRHMRKEHFVGYICELCGMSYSSYAGMSAHKAKHNTAKHFKCEECNKTFHVKYMYECHIATQHTNERPFKCEICGKAFAIKIYLQKHLITHNYVKLEKLLPCSICEQKFQTKSHLKRHLRTHTGEKPYACPICGKCFAQNYNLKCHIREHEKPGSTRRFCCKACNKRFSNENNFKIHCESGTCNKVNM